MAYDAAAGKSLVRAIVHRTLSLDALFKAHGSDESVGVRVRWHNKVTPRGDHGDLLDIGYADVIEGVDHIIFNSEELTAKGITPHSGDTVTILSPRFGLPVLTLQTRQPKAGPQETIWQVAQ